MTSACRVYSSTAGEGFKCISFPAWRPSRTAILSPQDVPAFIRTPQNDVTSDPVTPPSGRHVVTPSLSLPRSVFSITQLAMTHRRVRAHTHTHMQHTAPADWQELQTVQLHRLHFRSAATDWQPAEGWLLAGNTCFIYQPAGVCQAHYACDMGNLEVYFKLIEIMYYI